MANNFDNEARELYLHIANTGDIYENVSSPIIANLKKKHKKGIYSVDEAIKAWKRVADWGAKDYVREHGSMGDSPFRMFPVAARKAAAEMLEEHFRDEVKYSENPIKGKIVKKRTPAKRATAKRNTSVNRPSQRPHKGTKGATKAPTKRLINRRKKTLAGPRGYFANPIKGEKLARFYVGFVQHDGEQYYYGGSHKNGSPILDSNIQNAFISSKVQPLIDHMKAEMKAHTKKPVQIGVAQVYVDSKGKIIPGE